MNIEQRIAALEKLNQNDVETVTTIFLAPLGKENQLNCIASDSGHRFYLLEGESQAAFKARADNEVRRLNGFDDRKIIMLSSVHNPEPLIKE